MKKIAGLLCIVLIFSTLATGCGKKETGNEKDINLTFSFWDPGTGKAMENTLKEIISDYEKEHPNVHIKPVVKAVSGYSQWISTQAAVDNLPDIQSNHASELSKQYDQGYVIDLSDDLKKANPYNDGKIWKDTFKDGVFANTEYTYAMPYFGTGLSIFYNKTLYDKLGLKIPKTWNEFTDNCKKIEANGNVPIAFMAQKADAVDWLSWELTVGVVGKKLLSDPNINYNGDVLISTQEMVKSIKEGYLNYTTNTELQDLYKDYLKYFKEYLKYAPNARSYDESAAKTLFMTGKAAHIETGSWDIEGMLYNDEMPFEVGTFSFPRFTEENSKYGGLNMTVNATQTLGLTKSVMKEKGKKEAAIDFLMYFTSPKVHGKFVEGAKQIPVLKDVEIDPAFEGFVKTGYNPMYFYKIGTQEGLRFSEIEKKLIEGQDFNPTAEDFKQIQISAEAWAESQVENSKTINKETDWGMDTLVPDRKYTGEEYAD